MKGASVAMNANAGRLMSLIAIIPDAETSVNILSMLRVKMILATTTIVAQTKGNFVVAIRVMEVSSATTAELIITPGAVDPVAAGRTATSHMIIPAEQIRVTQG
jgi:hypothetical protein